jgi:transitional endoplasmic reticulum ATPase
MKQIKVGPGDVIEVEGDRKTACIADRAYPGDMGLAIIRMDGIIRRNAKTRTAVMVKVRKAGVNEAKRVVIAPAKKGIMIRSSSEIFEQALLGRALVKGDILTLGSTTKKRTTLANSPFEDIFKMLDEQAKGYGFGDMKFVVEEVSPENVPLMITHSTKVTCLKQK